MLQTVTDYISTITTGEKQTYKNLTVAPLLSPALAPFEYLLLDEAIRGKYIEVSEVTEGGHVPELKAFNKSDKMVLLLDGEEVVGAKQNRILNTTILVAAHTAVVIPVSCVEQGRWSYRSSTFGSQDRVMASSMRADKAAQVQFSLKESGTYCSDQGAIWDSIEQKATRRRAGSATMAMSDIYEKDKGSIEEYRRHFTTAPLQVGAVFLINGKIAGLDSFGRPDTFAKVFGKLLDSYALDAIDWYSPEQKEEDGNGIKQFIGSVSAAQAESRRSIALGSDIRFESGAVIGFALEHEKSILHLSAFAKNGKESREPASSRMNRFSARRKSRS